MALPSSLSAAPGGDPTASGAASAPGGGDSSGSGGDTITITPDGSGGWTVDDGDGDPPVPCKSIGDVIKAVHDALSGDSDSNDPQSAWADEASKRGPSGMPGDASGAGGSGGPAMTMP